MVVLKFPTGRNIEEGYELGHGKFGVTYLCTDRATGELFACKSISKKKLRTAIDVEDVRREVEIMRNLPQHPNIVTLKDTYEDDNVVHLVMELCEGGDLFDRILAKGHYTKRAAATVTKTIVEVVQVIEGAGRCSQCRARRQMAVRARLRRRFRGRGGGSSLEKKGEGNK